MKTATALLALLVSSAFAFSPTISRARFGTLSITTLSGQKTPFDHVMTGVVSGLTAFSLATGAIGPLLVQPVHAAESRLIGEIQGSGLIFKDTLSVESFDDPKVKGVTLYISNFQRPLNERLQKDFFSDPSYASVSCAKTGPVSVADNIKMNEEVFEEAKSLLFKTLRVQRIYDQEKNTVVYVSFNTRLDKNTDNNKSRFKSSICAVSLNN